MAPAISSHSLATEYRLTHKVAPTIHAFPNDLNDFLHCSSLRSAATVFLLLLHIFLQLHIEQRCMTAGHNAAGISSAQVTDTHLFQLFIDPGSPVGTAEYAFHTAIAFFVIYNQCARFEIDADCFFQAGFQANFFLALHANLQLRIFFRRRQMDVGFILSNTP